MEITPLKSHHLSCRFVKILLTSALACTLSACESPECTQYKEIIESDAMSIEIVRWADEDVFSRSFVDTDFSLGYLVGPGRNGALSKSSGVSLPDVLVMFNYWIPLDLPEIRPLGQQKHQPDAIFIGRKSFHGLLISREEMQSTLKNLNFPDRDIFASDDRLAIFCYQGP